MTATYIINGAIVDTVVYDDVELVEAAETGSIGSGHVTIRDDGGLQLVTGLKDFKATENDCTDELTLRGFVGQRTYSRGTAEHSNSRFIEVGVDDPNALLGWRAQRGADAKRPRETVGARLTWLLATPEFTFVEDHGRVSYSSKIIDKADHRKTYSGDILSECAIAAGGWNYYLYTDQASGDISLSFRDDNAVSSNTSTLRISNVHSDWAAASNTTLIPSDDAKLTRDPSPVYSKVALPYRNGTVWRENAATASNYRNRDGIAPSAHVKTKTKAIEIALDYLSQHRTEEDVIDCPIPQVQASQVNLVHAGDRIAAKFSHLTPEGYGNDFTYFRVLERRVRPVLRDNAPAMYEMDLKLSPQEPACGTIVQASAVTASPATASLGAIKPGNIIVAAGFRSATSAVPAIEYLGASAGFTSLGSPLESTGNDGGSEGRVWMQAKIIDGSTPAGPYSFSDGGRYLWQLFEVSADFGNRTVLSQAEGTAPLSGASSLSIGTFSGSGVAIMVQAVGKATGHAACTGTGGFVAMGGTWTERYDGRVDPVDSGSLPFIGIGTAPVSGTLAAQWDWTCPSGDLGTWAGIGCLFGC